MSGYDLKRRFSESVGFFYRASDGSLYPALKTLAKRGMVRMRTMRTGARARKLYAITPRGREWFLRTLAQPSPPILVYDESSVKLYFAHHRPEVVLKHLGNMREHSAEMALYLAGLEDEFGDNGENFPFRKLVVEMGKRITAFRAEMIGELAAANASKAAIARANRRTTFRAAAQR